MTRSYCWFGKTTCGPRVVAGHTSGYLLSNYAPQGAAIRRGPNIMLPSIRLVIAAVFATVVLMMGSFWLVSTFQIAKTSTGVPPRGALALDPALADGSERKQIFDSPSTNMRVTAAARFDHEETVVEMPANNVGATGVIKLASPSRSDDTDQTSSIASRPERTPTAAPVVALTEDLATVIDSPKTKADAAIAPTASADGRPVGGAIAAEALTNRGDEAATSTGPDATLSATPSTTAPDAIAAAGPPIARDTAGKSSPLRIVPRVTAADPSTIAAATTLAPSPSRTAAEETSVPSLPSAATEKRVALNASSATAVEETAIPALTRESPKATAPKKRTPNAAKPHAQAKKATAAHQATTSKAGTKTAAHLHKRKVRHATPSTAQPQNPVNRFGNFFGSQQVGVWRPTEIGAAR